MAKRAIKSVGISGGAYRAKYVKATPSFYKSLGAKGLKKKRASYI